MSRRREFFCDIAICMMKKFPSNQTITTSVGFILGRQFIENKYINAIMFTYISAAILCEQVSGIHKYIKLRKIKRELGL